MPDFVRAIFIHCSNKNRNFLLYKKSAICKIANDTLINSVKLCLAVAKLDTDVNIITDLFAIVNPPGEKSILTANVYSERLFL